MREIAPPPRPDTFLFPPETTFRFYALVAALFGALTFIWAWFYLSLPTTLPAFAACIRSANVKDDARQMVAQLCLNEFNLRQGLFVAACLAATALAVLLLHLLRPFLVIARQRLRPLHEVADPDALPPFRAALDGLVAEAGLRRPPRVLVRPRAMTEAFTFGNWFRRYLSLDSGLVGEFFTDRAAFDAKIRHELAHFRNRDISKAELTTISWWLFAAIVPLVLLYSLLRQGLSPALLAGLGWRFALVVGAVYLARNAVICAREFDADARAFAWDGPHGALIAAISAKAAAEADVKPWWRRRLPGILRLHPSAGERVAALRTPGSLLRAGTLILPAVIGLAFGIGEPPATFVLTFFTQLHGRAGLGGTIVAVLFLLPLAGWAGVAIWRDASGSLRRGLPDLFAAALGLAAAAGILGGFHLSFMAFITTAGNPSPALPTLVLTLFFLWVRAGAYWWQSSEPGRRLVVPACWISLAIGCFVLVAMWSRLSSLATLYNGMIMAGAFNENFGPLDLAWTFFRTVIVSPVTLLFFILLWLFVIAPRWLGLPPLERRLALRRRTRQVLTWTLAFAAILVAGRLYVRFSVEAGLRGSDEFKLWFFHVWLWTSALLQGGLAFVLAVRRPAATVAEACFCTLIAGLLMGVATLAVNVAFGGGLEFRFVVNTLCQYANHGALVALPMAALGSGIRFVAAGFRPLPLVAAAA